jgi:hypothetical protein
MGPAGVPPPHALPRGHDAISPWDSLEPYAESLARVGGVLT